jgi:hypothetical protein
LLARHDEREVVAVGDDEVEPSSEDFRALLRQRLRPGPEGFAGRPDRPDGLAVSEARDFRDQRAGRRIADFIDAFAGPRAVDQALGLEERFVGKFYGKPLGSEPSRRWKQAMIWRAFPDRGRGSQIK